MGTYIPSTWVNNQQPALNADNLNNMEAGISLSHSEIEDIKTGDIVVAHAATADHATSVDKATQTTIGGVKVWVDTSDPANIIGHIDAR